MGWFLIREGSEGGESFSGGEMTQMGETQMGWFLIREGSEGGEGFSGGEMTQMGETRMVGF